MCERISNQLVYLHKIRQNDTFQLWRSLNTKYKINELKKTNDEILSDNTQIAFDIKKLAQKQTCLSQHKLNLRHLKLSRILSLTLRRNMLVPLLLWKRRTDALSQISCAAYKIFKVERKSWLSRVVSRWRERVAEQKRIRYIETFLKNHADYKALSIKARVIELFRMHKDVNKRRRMILKRRVSQKYNDLVGWWWRQWKTFVHKGRVKVIQKHIIELDSQSTQNQKELDQLNCEIKTISTRNKEVSQKLLTQA